MKYVMLQHRTDGYRQPVFCVAPLTHGELAAAFARTHTPASAGFCEVLPGGLVHTCGYSASLNLKPAAEDAGLIAASLRATLAMVPQKPAA